jgi:hypothetical protein
MFLLHRQTQVLVEILELSDLFDPFKTEVLGMALVVQKSIFVNKRRK